MNDPIIFGKSNIQKVISIEPSDGHLELFIQNDDGSIRSEFIPNKYWILCNERVSPSWVRLKGDQHYKYGKQVESIQEYFQLRSRLRNRYDIYSIYDIKEASMVNKGICYYQGLQPKDISILSFDIETTSIVHNDASKLLIIANTFRDSKGNITRKLFSYDEYDNEGEMITSWCNWVREINPSILCGHNIYNFDIPYIKFIADRYGVTLDLGRNNTPLQFSSFTSKFRVDGNREMDYQNIKCYGREIIDTYFGLMKWDSGKQLESYGLKPAIKFFKLELENRQFYDASKIKDNYKVKKEWDKIKKYAEMDGDDALRLFDTIIGPQFYWTQSCPKSFQQVLLSATGSQINSIIVRSYLQNGYSIAKATDVPSYEGAVSIGIPGVYSNSFKQDILSCYPNTLLQYNIYSKNKDPESNVIKVVAFFFNKRKEYKKLAKETGLQYYKDLDACFKIVANSIYGFYGAPGLAYNFPEGASEITRYARGYIDKAIQWATSKNLDYWNNLNIQE